MPCMPATNTKSPALAPRLQVPSALMAPGGLSVLTPFGDGDCAKPRPDVVAMAIRQRRARRWNIRGPRLGDGDTPATSAEIRAGVDARGRGPPLIVIADPASPSRKVSRP